MRSCGLLVALVALVALAAFAAGCMGGHASAPTPASTSTSAGTAAEHPTAPKLGDGRVVAHLVVRGTYISASHPRVYRARFRLVWPDPVSHTPRGWSARLCRAILDYAASGPHVTSCKCPESRAAVDVRGTLHNIQFHERFSYCTACGADRRAGHDVRVILRIHPPVIYAA